MIIRNLFELVIYFILKLELYLFVTVSFEVYICNCPEFHFCECENKFENFMIEYYESFSITTIT